jgi:CDP-glycerol glycerophosphotransferase (TagB/SpsB family)
MNLLIKLHPSIERDHPFAAEELISQVEKHSQIVVIKNFPLIYPLLSSIDALITDVSSIGYDFLYFNRPLFLIAPDHMKKKHLHSITLATCSTILWPNKHFNSPKRLDKKLHESTKELKSKRKKLYTSTFDASLSEHNFTSHLLNFMQKQIYDFSKP